MWRHTFCFSHIASVLLVMVGLASPVVDAQTRAVTVTIPVDVAWTETALQVQEGVPLHIEAHGKASMVGRRVMDWLMGSSVDRQVGPQGTYIWPRYYTPRKPFPLPAMAEGPFPAFCLIGKIGRDGPPFYIGSHYDGVAQRSGQLWLGVNDDHPEDNRGQFEVTTDFTPHPQPALSQLPIIEPGHYTGTPIAGARALLLYVDGLRPDVLREMAAAGFLPHFKEAFLDQGVAIPNAFTVFPSNTLIANGSLFTGRFSDGTGIKSQNQFERATLKMRGQLSEWLPDGFIPKPTTRVINLLDKYAPENTQAFLDTRGIPTLASRLGKAYTFTTLPIAPLNPPPQWFHCAINTIGPFGVQQRLPYRLDAVNAQYAVEELIGDPDARAIAVWLPMVDKISHISAHGQFGLARRDLALADRFLGQLLTRLRQVHWDRSTYLLLISDHGHVGGQTSINRSCNFPRDWAYQQLGCNAKVVGQEWTHPGMDQSRFLFFDNQGAGQAKIFLPYGSYFKGPWQRNRLFELTHYEMRPRQTVNVLESLARFRPPAWTAQGTAPVDLMLVKLDAHRVFMYRDDDQQAIIQRDERAPGEEVYRYEPVRRLSQSADGQLHYEPSLPGVDPLGYLRDAHFLTVAVSPEWLTASHTAQEWLQATHQTRYPDAIVAISKFFSWRPPLLDLADVRDPDLVVTASEGWSFRSDDGQGTDHGYPFADSMRITFFIAGPNIPHGVLESPQRIINVLPTMLEMLHWSYDPASMDGEAIHGIYE